MLKKTFIHTNSNLPPATVIVNAAKCGLCRIMINCIVRFSHFLKFLEIQLVIVPVLNFICIRVSQMCLMVKYGDFWRWDMRWKRILDLGLWPVLIRLMKSGYTSNPLSQFTVLVQQGTQKKFTSTTEATYKTEILCPSHPIHCVSLWQTTKEAAVTQATLKRHI